MIRRIRRNRTGTVLFCQRDILLRDCTLRWLREEKGGETANRLAGYVREVPLSANKDFQRFYMEYMYFGEDEE